VDSVDRRLEDFQDLKGSKQIAVDCREVDCRAVDCRSMDCRQWIFGGFQVSGLQWTSMDSGCRKWIQ